ncbi:MAG: AbrB/MazE/SpoVT family DNA-binding domain-containing protein [Acidobacteria bacterium]|nr:AbrB/MazE/SpoVT family DNA-binding domain-containing protein [Acidobacteriota bacterium]
MQTKVSTQGNVLLPGAIRRQLGIKAGDELYADIQNGNIVLTPERKVKRSRKANIVTSAITGLPVLDAGKDAPVLTSEMVRDLLSDFP